MNFLKCGWGDFHGGKCTGTSHSSCRNSELWWCDQKQGIFTVIVFIVGLIVWNIL